MAVETDDLKNLSPAERLKRLKEIELQKKREIEEAQKLLTETAQELDEEEKKKEKIPIPQVAATDEAILFTVEEREVFRLRRFKDTEMKGNAVMTSTTAQENSQQSLDGLEDLVETAKTSKEAEQQAQMPQYATPTKKELEHQQQKYQTPLTAEEGEPESKYVGMYQRAVLEEEKFKVPVEKANVLHQAEKYLKGPKAKTVREEVEETVKYAK